MKGSTLSKAALFAALSITLVGCGSEEAADVSKVSQAEHQAPVKTAAVEVRETLASRCAARSAKQAPLPLTRERPQS